ncbi:MAG: hypothetical protein AAGD22_14690 [Verrucomicrobiota bacterium]
MPSESMPILLMSGGSAVGLNLIAALENRRDQIYLIATNSIADAPGLFDCDEVFLVPSTDTRDDSFETRIDQIFNETKPALVIPCRDDDVLWLAAKMTRSPDWSAKGLCGCPELADAMLNKQKSADFCRKNDLPFVPSIQLNAPPQALISFAETQGLPLIIKPAQGFASRHVSIVTDTQMLLQCQGTPDMVAQKFVGNPEKITQYLAGTQSHGVPLFHSFEEVKISLQTLISPEGKILAVFATKNTMRFGKSEQVTREENRSCLELAEKCAATFADHGWRGPLNIQCQQSQTGELLIIEFNGRFTGATSARYYLGYDEVGMALDAFASLPLPPPCLTGNSTRIVRLPSSSPIPENDAQALTRNTHWKRSYTHPN